MNWLDEFLRNLDGRHDPRVKALISVVRHGQKAPLSDIFTLADAVGLELKIQVMPKAENAEAGESA